MSINWNTVLLKLWQWLCGCTRFWPLDLSSLYYYLLPSLSFGIDFIVHTNVTHCDCRNTTFIHTSLLLPWFSHRPTHDFRI